MERIEKLRSRIANRKKFIMILNSIRASNSVRNLNLSEFEKAYYAMREEMETIILTFETLNKYDEIELGTL